MVKITTTRLQEIVKALNEGADAINTLERLNNNKFLYEKRKKRLQDLADELTSQYSLNELTDVNARDKKLEEDKKKADDNWQQVQNGTRDWG